MAYVATVLSSAYLKLDGARAGRVHVLDDGLQLGLRRVLACGSHAYATTWSIMQP